MLIIKMDRTLIVFESEADDGGDIENNSHSAWLDGGVNKQDFKRIS